jgi:ATP-binding cassette, subfamily B, bacterial
MAFVWNYVKKYKKLLALALLLAAINQIFSLLDPQIMRIIIDKYATNFSEYTAKEFLSGVALLLLGFVGVAFVSRTAKNFQDYFVNSITQNVGTDMYSESVKHTFSLPFGVFEDRRSGEILQKMLKARTDTEKNINNLINIVFLSVVGMIFVLIYAFIVHWAIALTFLLSVPFMVIIVLLLGRKIGISQKEIVRESAELSGATTETIRNVELVKSLGLENQEILRLNDVNDKIRKLELKKIKYIRVLSFIQGTIVNFVRACLLFLMLYLLYVGQVTIGEFLTLFFYSLFLFAPLNAIGEVVSSYQEAKASTEQLEEILKIKPEKKADKITLIKSINSISFKDMSFRYSAGDIDAVSKINLGVSRGEKIAFVGPSGSGKTTIIKLLLGLYKPASGDILFNDVSLKNIDYGNLRKRVGLVSQDTQLFAGTIKENLIFVNPDATNKECVESLKMAQAYHLVERGGKGLDTKIGEGGIKLSGGERQRLAIARALIRNPDLMIFDEATSALDSLTEKEITKTIKGVSKNRPDMISVTIAHRLSTVSHVDKIYVMEKGKIVEIGNHKELLGKKGLYAALWREQIAEE